MALEQQLPDTEKTSASTSARWEQFSGTLPKQGTMRNGVLYELPTPDFRTPGSASSSLLDGALLPTPNTWDGNKPKTRAERHHHRYSSRKGSDGNLREVVLYEYGKEYRATVAAYHKKTPAPQSLTPKIEYNGEAYECRQPMPWMTVDGEDRLNPVFSEWIMGLPEGWVTGVPGVNHFKLIGNGVAPPQAELALRAMLACFTA